MLNAQGRIICDILLYRTPHTRYECKFTAPGEAAEPDELLIECDSKLVDGLATTLHGYRVRRKVSLDILSNRDVWCLYPNIAGPESDSERGLKPVVSDLIKPSSEILENDLTIVCDPRLDLMGLRILSDSSANIDAIKKILQSKIGIGEIEESSVRQYTIHRYKLGLGEGPQDHIDGKSLPLESNADLLNSVSFDKGCYLGQELTARIRYTGVVRKRLMPTMMLIDKTQPAPALPFAPGSDIFDVKTNKRVGTLANIVGRHGLSLVRHDLVTGSSKLIHEATNVPLIVWTPYWWNLVERAS